MNMSNPLLAVFLGENEKLPGRGAFQGEKLFALN
jgi:hypothetical protein